MIQFLPSAEFGDLVSNSPTSPLKHLELLILDWFEGELSKASCQLKSAERGISLIRPNGIKQVVLSFGDKNSPLLQAFLDEEEFKKEVGKFPIMPETGVYSDEHQGNILDLEWAEKRNRQLGIRVSARNEVWTIPPKSLLKMIASYLFSSMGLVSVEKELLEDSNFRVRSFYRFDFVFLGGESTDDKTFWQERHYIEEAKFREFGAKLREKVE